MRFCVELKAVAGSGGVIYELVEPQGASLWRCSMWLECSVAGIFYVQGS